MGPPMVGNGDTAAKTTGNCEAPVELTGFRKWLSKNYLLLMTLSGVIVGIVAGEWMWKPHKNVSTYEIVQELFLIQYGELHKQGSPCVRSIWALKQFYCYLTPVNCSCVYWSYWFSHWLYRVWLLVPLAWMPKWMGALRCVRWFILHQHHFSMRHWAYVWYCWYILVRLAQANLWVPIQMVAQPICWTAYWIWAGETIVIFRIKTLILV